MSLPVWIIEYSIDGGKTWNMSKDSYFYKHQFMAEQRAEEKTHHHLINMGPSQKEYGYKFRARTYVPAEVL